MKVINVAMVAHDNKKEEMIKWVKTHKETIKSFNLFGTGTTGRLIEEALGQPVHRFLSGPLGGDQQIGAAISEGKINMLIFFWDPLESLPHDPDIKALLRLAAVWNIPLACTVSSADLMIHSSLLKDENYEVKRPDYTNYTARQTPADK
ncbi:MAG: methylglyoxal synthase [Saccharospirillaceae bacterium]|nr:methylglyoxal synthase [Pseudomonadales bacterium]NRB79553.1 methylglyoxal synthase [Saccharospirillaceae bacterium]